MSGNWRFWQLTEVAERNVNTNVENNWIYENAVWSGCIVETHTCVLQLL